MTTFTTRELPWIKLGAVIDHPVNAAEAAKLGGLDFKIELADAGFRRHTAKNELTRWQSQTDRRALVREDTGEFYGFCSQSYKPVQYADAFDFLDEISPEYVAAGTLNGGRQGFMVIKLPEHGALDVALKGERDPHDLYAIVRASHDMSKGVEVATTTLRGKCMNMLTLPSLTADAPQRWSIRHIGNPHAKLREAQSVLSNVDKYEQAFRSITRRLVDVQVKRDEVPMLLERVLPNRPQREKQIDAITAAYDGAPTVGFTGTGWGVVNAVSEYFMWERSGGLRTAESTFRDNLDGAAHKMVGRTAQLLLRR
jgi:phage/plasmid-like protein (TIGR03299 family)